MDKNELAHARGQIDALDAQIIKLLGQRADIAKKVGDIKKGKNIYQPAREAQVIANAAAANHSALPNESLKIIYKEIIAACRNLQKPLRVVYLGPIGSYCEEAAQRFCGASSELTPASSIPQAASMAEAGEADLAIIPIENSTEGSVHITQDLLLGSPLTISREILLPIHHQLLTKATKITEIKKVMAHPQALAQCRNWLAQNLPNAEQIAASSNSEAACQAANKPDQAAIASKRAGEIYNLPIFDVNIEDAPNNTTRFIVLGGPETEPSDNDTTALICTLPNSAGSLQELLAVFASAGINLTKLESRPTQGAKWEYHFYVQLDGHQKDQRVARALQEAGKRVAIKIVGSYPKASDAS